MNFDSTDWEAEAQRVRIAFEVEEACKFEQLIVAGRTFIPAHRNPYWNYAKSSRGIEVVVFYSAKNRRYSCCGDEVSRVNGAEQAVVVLGWDDAVHEVFAATAPDNLPMNTELARGLFHLGLLSPEVENGLNLSISAHEKLEWMQEYEKRNGL